MWPFFAAIFTAFLSLAVAQNPQAADGPIVPFTSVLPACASNCGALFDVQGKCAPPNIPAVSRSCFCADSRLVGFLDVGTAGVSDVCVGAGSCTTTAELESLKNWYEAYCVGLSMTVTSYNGLVATTFTLSDSSVLSTSPLTSHVFTATLLPTASTTTKTSITSTSSVVSTSSPTPAAVGNGSLIREVKIVMGISTAFGAILLLAIL